MLKQLLTYLLFAFLAFSAPVASMASDNPLRVVAPPGDTCEAPTPTGLTVVNVTPTIVLEAVRGVIDHQLSFWDALIWATAKLNQIAVILSEDFRSGASLEGVRFVNPLSDDFDLELWLGNE